MLRGIRRFIATIARRNDSPAPSWACRLAESVSEKAAGDRLINSFIVANVSAIEDAVIGRGPDKDVADAKAGARMVVNISSAHVPAFCRASRAKDDKPYKNGYDLKIYRIADPPPGGQLGTREIVDRALPLKSSVAPSDIYFGAIELNGTGIRFYGDVCLVLKRDALDNQTVILDRNSYDLMRAPIRDTVDRLPHHQRDQARKDEALKLHGVWGADVGSMAALKTLQALGIRPRRYTTGQISSAIRDDEDYMEILKIGSFGAGNLQEARISAGEAAHDALTGDRLLSPPSPRLEALIWRHRRRRAEQELRQTGVRVAVVATSGRIRS